MKRIIFVLFVITAACLPSGDLFSQSIHFTNNDMVPTYFNPAQTGAYSGTYRAGLILRDQWRPLSSDPYVSGGLFVDSPIVFGLTKQHWVGVGATLLYDQAGEVSQTWSEFIPGVSYHIGLDKKFNNVITVGVQYGFANRGYKTEGWRTEEGVLSGSANYIDPDLERISAEKSTDNFSAPTSHLNIGVLYKSNLDKFSKFEIGGAYMNVINSEIEFKGVTATHPDSGATYAIPGKSAEGSRLNVHTKYRRATSKRMIWEPSAYLSFMPGASNINLQLRNEYLLKKGGDISLISGLGMRFGDAIQLLLGANYKGYLVSFAYDHTIADHGGYDAAYELGVM
ncbi:MAG: type IX secretion system PorP/SprF family membrane protein, partial [Saprospiraceae bacterium]